MSNDLVRDAIIEIGATPVGGQNSNYFQYQDPVTGQTTSVNIGNDHKDRLTGVANDNDFRSLVLGSEEFRETIFPDSNVIIDTAKNDKFSAVKGKEDIFIIEVVSNDLDRIDRFNPAEDKLVIIGGDERISFGRDNNSENRTNILNNGDVVVQLTGGVDPGSLISGGNFFK
jgi:hypothetical protein